MHDTFWNERAEIMACVYRNEMGPKLRVDSRETDVSHLDIYIDEHILLCIRLDRYVYVIGAMSPIRERYSIHIYIHADYPWGQE